MPLRTSLFTQPVPCGFTGLCPVASLACAPWLHWPVPCGFTGLCPVASLVWLLFMPRLHLHLAAGMTGFTKFEKKPDWLGPCKTKNRVILFDSKLHGKHMVITTALVSNPDPSLTPFGGESPNSNPLQPPLEWNLPTQIPSNPLWRGISQLKSPPTLFGGGSPNSNPLQPSLEGDLPTQIPFQPRSISNHLWRGIWEIWVWD